MRSLENTIAHHADDPREWWAAPARSMTNMQRAARAGFADDVRSGYFEVEPLADRHAIIAYDVIDQLSGHTLRTLDALRLAIAHSAGTTMLATADRQMARAAEALGMGVVTFG